MVIHSSIERVNEKNFSNSHIIGIFQAHLAQVKDQTDINRVMEELKKNRKIREATHNILAYRIIQPSGSLFEHFDDDGEGGAGIKVFFIWSVIRLIYGS
jgi:putative IMPACT (imprinted ancient) family translation regulator